MIPGPAPPAASKKDNRYEGGAIGVDVGAAGPIVTAGPGPEVVSGSLVEIAGVVG